MSRADVLYVKLKTDSPLTVSRARIDDMAAYFQQDATFVTHFALARLRDEIASGRLSQATEIPIASSFLSPQQVGHLQQYADEKYGTPEVKWNANPALDELLGR
jgi:2'-5' RNA ligase